MIKNDNQLQRSLVWRDKILEQLTEFRGLLTGIELEIIAQPLADEVKKLEREIAEYRLLSQLTLAEAVHGPLSRPMLLGNVGELLAKLRLASGITQEELAGRMGWQQSNVSRFESGDYQGQTIAKAVEYASALGIRLQITPSLTEEDSSVPLRIQEPYDQRSPA